MSRINIGVRKNLCRFSSKNITDYNIRIIIIQKIEPIFYTTRKQREIDKQRSEAQLLMEDTCLIYQSKCWYDTSRRSNVCQIYRQQHYRNSDIFNAHTVLRSILIRLIYYTLAHVNDSCNPCLTNSISCILAASRKFLV